MESVTVKLSDGISIRLALDDLIKNDTSLIEFLCFLDIGYIEEYVFQKYYERKPQYNVGGMIRLTVAYYFYDKGYKFVNSLTKTEIELLKFKKAPSLQQLQHFIAYRIKTDGLNEIMKLLCVKLDNCAEEKKIDHMSQDSTPIEAARYDKYAERNEHYGCKMYKSHITMKGTIPMYMTFSRGNANDSPYFKPHAYLMKCLNVNAKYNNLDAGYDSFENHALSACVLGAYPYIGIRENAVENEEGKEERIDYWCNKFWKEGGNPHAPIEERLEFLFMQGRLEQVGAYYRNKNLKKGMPSEITDLRQKQERIHEHIKSTVKFDVRYRHNARKELHILAAFVSYQLLVLTAMQNELNPNEFAFIRR